MGSKQDYAREALLAITIPTADAVKRDMTHSLSVSLYCSCMVSTAAGTIPQLPAVGAATILPMEAFNSDTARAR